MSTISMDRWRGKVAVVTGASSGIGAAVAERLVHEGLKVVGIARRVERIVDLSSRLGGKEGKLFAVKADMTNSEDVIKAFAWIKKKLGPVHILINNAGLTLNTSLMSGDIEKWKTVVDTNVLGLCVATREAVDSMIENKVDGHIIHINSLAGHKVFPIPNMNVYFASKFAVTALAETLKNELGAMGSKTKITSLSPGYVHTELQDVFDISPEMLESLKDKGQNAEDLADHVVYILSCPEHVQIHELTVGSVGEQF